MDADYPVREKACVRSITPTLRLDFGPPPVSHRRRLACAVYLA
jgi:hypothetical protein